MGKIICVEGLVGIGKTTFAQEIANHTNAIFIEEPVNDNPYLADFYKDMNRWGFSMQMELLYRRFDQHWYAQQNEGIYVFDRGITGDRVFADMLHESGHIGDREYQTYCYTHRVLVKKLIPADLILYLDGKHPTFAYNRILNRNRYQEKGISLEYLKNMDKHYKHIFLSNGKDEFVRTSKTIVYDWTNSSTDPRFFAPIIRSLDRFIWGL